MITAHFESIYDRLLEALWKAQHSVQLCVAWISAGPFKHVLYELADRGVRIEMAYFEHRFNATLHSHFPQPTFQHYVVTPRAKRAFMHHKFCVIDDEILITGSYNWTQNAARGFENVLIMRDEFELIKQYKHEFADIKDFVKGLINRQRQRCSAPRCASEAYHLAVFYPDDGLAPIATGIWRVCEKEGHAQLISSEPFRVEEFEPLLDEDANETFARTDATDARKQKMLREFDAERRDVHFVKAMTGERFLVPINAYGTVREKDEALNSKGTGGHAYRFPEREISVQWRDVYYRKTIPEILDENFAFGQIVRGRQSDV